ncbi:MAG: arylsulfatase [Candidatus Aminicenantes bacterium]|nr:MAG: arylsulfatase [Candidatus Aminicenantes bacterium]
MKSQTRRNFLKNLGAATVLVMTRCSSKNRKKPNVILVMTDDQGYGDIGAHGSPYVKTPNLDRLHRESVRLTNFHVDPCCSPTRASLLTGQYSARTGVWHTIGGRSLLRKDKITMADVFRFNGYKTAIFGKWHLGDNYPFRPQDRGFEEVLIHKSGVAGNTWDYWGNDYYDDTYIRNGKPEKFEGYCNSIWFDEAIKFIRKNREKPFFCFLSTNIPHAPLRVDDKYSAPYRSHVSEQLANYYGMISKFDEDMATLLKELKELELEENTILIFMSDNGPCPWYGGIKIDDNGFVEEGYSAGMRGGKIWGYENAHRVPCFIRWPAGKIVEGKDIKKLTAHFDLLPTLIEACGLEKPDDAVFDGKSLMPLITRQEVPWPERTLFVHNQRVDFPEKYKDYQVLTERWRLIKRNNEELYEIQKDPGQKFDVAAQNPDIVHVLHQKYEEWWEDISQNFDAYDEIIIGSESENPTILYSHDAHRRNSDRVWVINVERNGEYEFKASRWPVEANKRIGENREGDVTSVINQAHLSIGNIQSAVYVEPNMKFARFIIHLIAGTTCMQAWFQDQKDNMLVAEFVSVKRLGPADPTEIDKYRPSDPDQKLKE